MTVLPAYSETASAELAEANRTRKVYVSERLAEMDAQRLAAQHETKARAAMSAVATSLPILEPPVL